MTTSFEDLAPEYRELWRTAQLRPERAKAVHAMAKRMLSHKERYLAVEAVSGVPWYVIGILHGRESTFDFDTHLHNGDPLTARTKHVPRGRPIKGRPPFTWEESAADALSCDGLDQIKDWTPERICWAVESFNGWGYRKHHADTLSPYLWAGTAHYRRGKYVQDGQWSSEAVDQQCGAIAVLRAAMEIDTSILEEKERSTALALAPSLDAPGPVSTAVRSKTVWASIIGFFSWLVAKLEETFGLLPEVKDTAQSVLDPIDSLSMAAKINLGAISAAVIVACTGIVIYRHTQRKRRS